MPTVGSAGIGIMEKWNEGIMGSKETWLSYLSFYSSIPTFHPSFSKDANLRTNMTRYYLPDTNGKARNSKHEIPGPDLACRGC
jgi:hypothetical protein